VSRREQQERKIIDAFVLFGKSKAEEEAEQSPENIIKVENDL
jgi:hypothetical protein